MEVFQEVLDRRIVLQVDVGVRLAVVR
jgi:hypothetical protein